MKLLCIVLVLLNTQLGGSNSFRKCLRRISKESEIKYVESNIREVYRFSNKN